MCTMDFRRRGPETGRDATRRRGAQFGTVIAEPGDQKWDNLYMLNSG